MTGIENKKKMKRLPRGFKKRTTNRGFQVLEFKDLGEERTCTIQMSSRLYKDMFNSALWLKCELAEGEDQGMIHLSIDHVKALMKIFQHWIDEEQLFPR